VAYFRRNFVLCQQAGTIWQAPDDDGGFLRQYLPSRITDNPNADREAQRRRLSAFGRRVARSLIEGDWSAPGGDFFPEWNEDIHAVGDFVPPEHWFKFRVLDLGYSDPAYVGWFTIS